MVAALGFRTYAQYLSLTRQPNQCTRASVQPTIPLGILKVKLSENTKAKMSANAMKSTPAKTKVTKLIAMLEKDLAEKETYNQSLEGQVRVLNDLVRSMAGELVDQEAV